MTKHIAGSNPPVLIRGVRLYGEGDALDVLIGRIRRKLGAPDLLVTERGQGFRLKVD